MPIEELEYDVKSFGKILMTSEGGGVPGEAEKVFEEEQKKTDEQMKKIIAVQQEAIKVMQSATTPEELEAAKLAYNLAPYSRTTNKEPMTVQEAKKVVEIRKKSKEPITIEQAQKIIKEKEKIAPVEPTTPQVTVQKTEISPLTIQPQINIWDQILSWWNNLLKEIDKTMKSIKIPEIKIPEKKNGFLSEIDSECYFSLQELDEFHPPRKYRRRR